MTENERKTLLNEVDMLNGNINRMCVTDDQEEMTQMYEWAKRRIDRIKVLCTSRLQEK